MHRSRKACSNILAPISAYGDNVYMTWWYNKTRTRKVFFRGSTDGGKTFGKPLY